MSEVGVLVSPGLLSHLTPSQPPEFPVPGLLVRPPLCRLLTHPVLIPLRANVTQ